MKLGRLAKSLAGDVNGKRREKGLLPRSVSKAYHDPSFSVATYMIEIISSFQMMQVRAGIIGYPNVGKSSLINRLLKRKICAAAPRPGVTREMK